MRAGSLAKLGQLAGEPGVIAVRLCASRLWPRVSQLIGLDQGPISRAARRSTMPWSLRTPCTASPADSIVDDNLAVPRALGRLVQVAGYSVETLTSAHKLLGSSASVCPCGSFFFLGITVPA